MLPTSHITYTVAAFDLAKDRIPALKEIDYRLAAIAAMGPDLIDKPLAAAYFYRKQGAAVLFAHTLLAHLAVLLYAVWRRPRWWPYLAAFNGHAILDRLWLFDDTWYWPLRGWRFHQWKKAGSEQKDIKLAYWYTFTRRPELWGWEAGGLIAGLWVVWKYRLYRFDRLLAFCLTGKLS